MLQPKDTDWLNGYKSKTHYICCLQETHFRPKDTYRLKVRGWKSIFHANGKQNKAAVAILISDKMDFKIKIIIRDKEGHCIMIKGSIQGKDLTTVNIYAPNIGVPQYIRQTKVNRIQYHQTSFTTNVKVTYIVKKYKRRRSTKSNPNN